MTSTAKGSPWTAPGQRQPLPQEPADFAMAIYRAATDDAVAVAERLTVASRAAAVGRFEQMWPSVPDRPIPTRRVLRDWYLYVYQQQLDRGLHAPADSPIDGNRAEQVFTRVRRTSGAPTDVVIDTVLTLARDARLFASNVSTAQDAFVATALAGRVGTVFPRKPGVPVGARQAIGEQWYIRTFRAELDPVVFHLTTRSLRPAEIARVVDDLAANVHRVSDRANQAATSEAVADRERHAALAWHSLLDHRRLRWLTDHNFRPRLFSVSWAKLPRAVQDQLVAEIGELEQAGRGAAATAPAMLTGVVEAAAARFGKIAVHPVGPAELAAARALFRRGGVGFPPELIGDQPQRPAVDALNRLKAASPGSAETRGLPRQGWWTETDALDKAVRMRVSGANWTEIGRTLGVSGESARRGLVNYGDVDPALTRRTPRRLWTPEELATAASLRAEGRRWSDIAVLIGRSNGKAVWQAVHADERRKTGSADSSMPRVKSGGSRPPAPGL